MIQKGSQTNRKVVLVELGSAVPVLFQVPQADASPGVRPERSQIKPWLQRIPLPILENVHSTNPTALTPLSRLQQIIPDTRQHLLKGPGHLPQHSNHTHRPRPQLFKKQGTAKVAAQKYLGPSLRSLLPPCLRPRRIIPGTLYHPRPQGIIPGTSGTSQHISNCTDQAS